MMNFPLQRSIAPLAVWVFLGCATPAATPTPTPALAPPPDTVRIVDTVRVGSGADAELAQQVPGLQLRLLEKEAEVAALRGQLEDAIQEVVRSMARLQTLATRAEAASAMAEAEVALQQLERGAGGRGSEEYRQAKRMLDMSGAEFNQQNFGGSVYLANQAKSAAATARGRLAQSAGDAQPGEVRLSVPVPLEVTTRSNVREGPGTRFGVAFTLDRGAAVMGHAYVDQWVRITDAEGRPGWIFYSLVSAVR